MRSTTATISHAQRRAPSEQAKREKLRKTREATFQRIVGKAPATFNAPQLRVLLRALVSIDPFEFVDDLAADIAGNDENEQRTAEEVLLNSIGGLKDEKLPGFFIRLAFAGHRDIPRDGDIDLLTEAEGVFVPKPTKQQKQTKTKTLTPITAAAKSRNKVASKKSREPKKAIAA